MENILLDTMFDLPDMTGVDEIVVDKDVVADTKEPRATPPERRF